MKKLIAVIAMILFLTGCTPTTEILLEAGNDTVSVFDDHELKGCIVSIGDEEYDMTVVSNSIDTETVGEYIVDYELTIEEETYTCQRVVFVVDHESPVLSLLPGTDTIYVGETWVDGGAEVTDNYDQNLTITVTQNTIDNTAAGSYQVEYQATDSSGNIGSIIRYVYVLENE